MSQGITKYAALHGKTQWPLAAYSGNVGLIKNYIRPYIGDIHIDKLDRHFMSGYFQRLQDQPRASNKLAAQKAQLVGISTILDIHKLLNSIFRQAIYWGYLTENPITHIRTPRQNLGPKSMLNADQIKLAVNAAIEKEDYTLALPIHLSFICSMRKGEALKLCWSDIDFDKGCLRVNKELARASLDTLKELNYKGVYQVFDPQMPHSTSRLILKEPKTYSAIRTVYMPPSFVEFMTSWKNKQEKKQKIGDEEYDLIFTSEDGSPLCPSGTTKRFKALLKDLSLPKLHFHILRYSGTSYKLIMSRGDIKAVQGDNGHAQPDMVLSVYAQIQEEQRIKLAGQMEENFCSQITPMDSRNAQK